MKSIYIFMLTILLSFNTFASGVVFNSEIEINTSTDSNYNTDDIDLGITSKSAILIEASTGTVLYSKNEDKELKPASVTKIMTLLLCFDQISKGKFTYEDEITISQNAASMGGSQCFFEAGEIQSVYDIIKCIEISSGNDAAVAMGEYIAGSEDEFVKLMNQKAKELGMNNTNFENACGLDSPNHYTCAKDIGIMSRELIINHPEIFDISTIWMDHITHKTSKGESRFDLANTNKFLKQYAGANGLKTGFTSEAGYCISATANRDGVTLIAVVMGASTKEIRNNEVSKLLDYGFSKCEIYTDKNVIEPEFKFKISNGVKEYVNAENISQHKVILVNKDSQNIVKQMTVKENLKAPIKKGETIGMIQYMINDSIIAQVEIKSSENIAKKSYSLSIRDLCNKYFVVE